MRRGSYPLVGPPRTHGTYCAGHPGGAHLVYPRIPSYLGMLLDVSRRNLDRVLYFAQYIVSYVDEDARQKALKRLEDEISVSEREQAGVINSKIAEIKTGRISNWPNSVEKAELERKFV